MDDYTAVYLTLAVDASSKTVIDELKIDNEKDKEIVESAIAASDAKIDKILKTISLQDLFKRIAIR